LKANLLVIDDSEIIQALINKYIGENYNIYRAESAEKGLNKLIELKLKKIEISVILTDVHMSGMSGPDFIKLLQSSSFFDDIPFILMSASEHEKLKYHSLCNKFIIKPFKRTSLCTLLEEVLNQDSEEQRAV
jgi:response regulator RpfG family c-di-GMP phosphodiesterase